MQNQKQVYLGTQKLNYLPPTASEQRFNNKKLELVQHNSPQFFNPRAPQPHYEPQPFQSSDINVTQNYAFDKSPMLASHPQPVMQMPINYQSQHPQNQPSMMVQKELGRSFLKPETTNNHNNNNSSISNTSPHQLQLFMREVRDKLFRLGKTLNEHEQQLCELKDQKMYSSSHSTSVSSLEQGIRYGGSGMPNPLDEFEQKRQHARIIEEIETVRKEILDKYIRREHYEADLTRQLNDLKSSLASQVKILHQSIKREMDAQKTGFNENFRNIFSRVDLDMTDLKQQIQLLRSQNTHLKIAIEEHKSSNNQGFFSSNKRFNGAKMVKYKETLQLLGQGFEKAEEITINQNKEGYLLDRNHCYLVDKSSRQVQLDQKHLSLLKIYNLLS